MAALWFWLLSFFFIVGLLCTLGFQLMCLVDLEFDYVNPYDSASRINMVIVPEFVAQGVLCFFYLLTGNWLMFLFSLPYLCYNVRLYIRRQHLVDVTEIYNQLRWEKKRRFFKIAYLLILFFLSLFWLLWSVTDEHDD
ncbi:protein cornichon homolog 4-like [Corylus avellana]|uniref:protein cornichon homolog 4-like n=1 Tax=Corylus avellana TaxID=13451 RepID=UPI00286B380D|nr:protein cornichon homolog 4-like [Corylus avellana]